MTTFVETLDGELVNTDYIIRVRKHPRLKWQNGEITPERYDVVLPLKERRDEFDSNIRAVSREVYELLRKLRLGARSVK